MGGDWRRRQVIAGLGSSTLLGTAGCLRTISGNTRDPADAEFEFVHGRDGSDTLEIRYTGDGAVQAGSLQLRSEQAATAMWPELGSTSEAPSDTLSEGTTARLGASIINWPHDITGSSIVRVVYLGENDSPTTLAVFTGSEDEGSSASTEEEREATATPTASPATFEESFEDGDWKDRWRRLWLQSGSLGGGTQSGEVAPLNDWTVDEEHAMDGEYAVHLHSDADGNALGTRNPVIELPERFDFEYSFYTPDIDSRQLRVDLVDISRFGSADDLVTQAIPHISLGSPRRAPAKEKASFRVLGASSSIPYDTFPQNETHRVRVERRGDTVRGYKGETEVMEGTVDLSGTALDLSEPQQLLFRSSGAWGAESNIWIDDISFETKRP